MLHLIRFRRYGPLLKVGPIILSWTVGAGALWYVLPLIAERIVSDYALVGALVAIPGVIAIFVDLPLGDLDDRVGGRTLLLYGFLLLAVLGYGLQFVSDVLSLLLFLVVLGILNPFFYVPMKAYVMDVSPRKKCSEFLAYEMSFIMAGFSLGPIAAGYLLSRGYGFSQAGSMLYVAGCLSALVVALALFKDVRPTARVSDSLRKLIFEDKVFKKELADYLKLKSTGLGVLAFTVLFTFYDGAVWMIQPLYSEAAAGDNVVAGLLMAAFVIPYIIFEIPGGVLADRFGRRKILFLGLLVSGFATVSLSQVSEPWMIFVAAFTATAGLALCWPSMDGILSSKTVDGARGSVAGVWNTGRDMGYVVGPLGGGLLAHAFGLSGAYLAIGALILVLTPLVLLLED